MAGLAARHEVKLTRGGLGAYRELHSVVLGGREAQTLLSLIADGVNVGIVSAYVIGHNTVLDAHGRNVVTADGGAVHGEGHLSTDGRTAHEVLTHNVGVVVVVAHAVDVGIGGYGGARGRVGLAVLHGDEHVHGVGEVGLSLDVLQGVDQHLARLGEPVCETHMAVLDAVARALGIGVVALHLVGHAVGEHDGVGVGAREGRLGDLGIGIHVPVSAARGVLIRRRRGAPVGIHGRLGVLAASGKTAARKETRTKKKGEDSFEFHSMRILSAETCPQSTSIIQEPRGIVNRWGESLQISAF